MDQPAFTWRGTPVSRRALLAGVGAVTAFLAVDLGAVAYANNWIGDRFARQAIIDRFQSLSGVHPGFRRNHAKGVVVAGRFESTGAAAELTTATVLAAGDSPVIGRFSLGGGNPTVADTPGAVRGFGVALGFPGRRQWRTAMINLPVFPVNSPEAFYDQLLASAPNPATGKPDPDAMAAFLTKYPASAAATKVIKQHPPTPGFADSTFAGLNTFYFVDGSGARTPVRWFLVPRQQARPAARTGPNVLFDALVRQLKAGPLSWDLRVVVGTDQDPVDPTLPWPADRRVVTAGTLVLDTVETEAPGNARDVNFDPLTLPDGIEPSDDPILGARSAVYAASYRLRTGEPKSPSAVQVDEVAP
ncbi:catalase [Mycolicibacterium chubuense NBB4]|uniref:Catalase-related peroxidase n=1 Tax=Mycolicibacterium chubuense (strain NBB4) TaxID=710421 RepID=I4BC52_MYCCN|nr:catalase family peroxidase [Mycolicibacterium chubuense]AFM14859.1 catalase [Mycolicibacterium chubuense NBB4]